MGSCSTSNPPCLVAATCDTKQHWVSRRPGDGAVLAYSAASHVSREPFRIEVIELRPPLRAGESREGNFTWHRIG